MYAQGGIKPSHHSSNYNHTSLYRQTLPRTHTVHAFTQSNGHPLSHALAQSNTLTVPRFLTVHALPQSRVTP